MRNVFRIVALVAVFGSIPDEAFAQYKNRTFGLDAGYWVLTKPSLLDDNNAPLPADERPLRFDYGIRVGGESNFKMNSDHWWFTLRVGVGIFQYGGDENGDQEERFEALANDAIGTVMGIEGQMGVRYVFLTDRVRPYLQVAVSYMRLFTFSGSADDTCIDQILCGGGAITNNDAFLPTQNIGAAHIQPGLELILERDIALHLYMDLQRWVRFSAADNWAPVFGVGVNFFS
ncbi:MAG: hypothetical protein AAFQ65_15620 [Myxococcota bacterium]